MIVTVMKIPGDLKTEFRVSRLSLTGTALENRTAGADTRLPEDGDRTEIIRSFAMPMNYDPLAARAPEIVGFVESLIHKIDPEERELYQYLMQMFKKSGAK